MTRVWVSCVRWRPTAEEMVRYGRGGSTQLPARTLDGATPELLGSWLAHGQTALSEAGEVLLEVVEPSVDDREELAAWLEPIFGDSPDDAAEFLTMHDPLPSFSHFSVGPDGADDMEATHFRVTQWLELARATESGDATLAVRTLRLVAGGSAAVIAWGPPGGYPHPPAKREPLNYDRLPGRVVGGDMADQARRRGDPDWLVEFEHGMANDGPRGVPQMLSEWEEGAGQPGQFAEELFACCVNAAHTVARDQLSTELDRWEASLMQRAEHGAPKMRSEVVALASIGRVVDFIGHTARSVAEPTSHEPIHYFAASQSSEHIEKAADDALAEVRRLRDRLRGGLALVSAVATSEALQLAQETQSSNERFQRTIGILGAVILGPSFVGGFFGANTAIPGEGAWWGFGLMVALMVLSVLALLGVLRWLR